MTSLFKSGSIGKLDLKNRIIRSATWEGMCEKNGQPTPELIQLYARLAKGGIGLIISGYAFVRPDGKQNPGKIGIHTDDFETEFRQMTRTVHDLNGKIALQLVHAGALARPQETGLPTVAPTTHRTPPNKKPPLELSGLEIEDITDCFARAARRAKAYGFDAIQIHGAHGYLVSQFLSPATNHRIDAYGGSLENRSRFLMELYWKIRVQVGPDFPIMIKMNAADHSENGLSSSDAKKVASMLSDAGIDAIEVSSGSPASGGLGPARENIDDSRKEAYNLDLATSIKSVVTCPVICVGGFRSLSVATDAVDKNGMDFISMARPLICEPDLPDKWKNNIATKSACISCNKCFFPGMTKGGISCVMQTRIRQHEHT